MKVLVCGSRDWDNYSLIQEKLSLLPKNTTIIHGGCDGADSIASEISMNLGFQVIEFKADWKKFGRSAGPQRNQQMLNEGPDIVYAFHDDLESSKGTNDMVERARKKGITVKVFSSIN